MGHWKSFWEEGHLHRGLEEARTEHWENSSSEGPLGGLCWCSGEISACAVPVQARWSCVGVSFSSSQLRRKPALCSECTRKPEEGLNGGEPARICNFEGPLWVGAGQALGDAGTERAFEFPAFVQVGDGGTPQLWGCTVEGELRDGGRLEGWCRAGLWQREWLPVPWAPREAW